MAEKAKQPKRNQGTTIFMHTTAVTVAATGNNPTVKTLERTYCVSVDSIHQGVPEGVYTWIHTRSEHMTADVFTKPFAQPHVFMRLKMLINI